MKKLKHLLILFVLLIGGSGFLLAQSSTDNLNISQSGSQNQTICNDGSFTALNFSCYRTGMTNYNNAVVQIRHTGGTNVLSGASGTWSSYAIATSSLPYGSTNAITLSSVPTLNTNTGTGNYEFRLYAQRQGGGGNYYYSSSSVSVSLTRKAQLSHSAIALSNPAALTDGDTYTGTSLAPLTSGQSYVWTKSTADASKNIGLAANGTGNIPSFEAKNSTSSPISVIYYVHIVDATCSSLGNSAAGTAGKAITFTVNPFSIPVTTEAGLIMDALQDQTVLLGNPLSNVSLKASSSTIASFSSKPVKFAIQFDNGVDVLNLGNTVLTTTGGTAINWNLSQYSSLIRGEGVYKITPVCDGKAGVTRTIKLTVDYPLDQTKIQLPGGGNLTVYNGEQISEYNLLSSVAGVLPAGTEVHWKWLSTLRSNNENGSGINTFPSFTAANIGTTAITLNYEAWLVNGASLSATVPFTITVNPRTVADPDLVMKAVEDQKTCFNTAFSSPLTLDATHIVSSGFTGDVTYSIEFAGGTNVLGLNAAASQTSGATQTSVSYTLPTPVAAGTGAYRITPTWNGNAGVAVLFNVTVAPDLNTAIANVVIPNFTYTVGDNAPLYLITSEAIPAGASVVWAKVSGSAIAELENGGVNVIPAFATSVAGTATYSYKLKYNDCESTTKQFSVTINDATPTYDLTVAAIENQTLCNSGAFAAITLTPNSTDPAFNAADVSYRWEFASGTHVLNAISGTIAAGVNSWTPVKAASLPNGGTGVYKITPVVSGVDGAPIEVALTVRPDLAGAIIDLAGKTVSYKNGDMIDAITFGGYVPEGAIVSWAATGDAIGLADAAGTGGLAAFSAVNTGIATKTAVYTLTVQYADDATCTYTLTDVFTIKVEPKTIGDLDLVTEAVAPQSVCFADNLADVTFVSKRTDGVTLGATSYTIEFVEGVDVINVANGLSEVAEAANGLWAISTATKTAGTGTYRVTPRSLNGEGKSALFTLTVYPDLSAIALDMIGNTATYRNGDAIDAIAFTGNIPDGVKITWNATGAAIGLSSANGTNTLPAFTAINTGSTNLTATINFTATCVDNASCTSILAGVYTIVVEPKTVSDLDLVMKPVASQTNCNGSQFANITFEAERTDAHALGNVTYLVEYVDGVDVINLSSPLNSVDNTGVWNISSIAASALKVGTGTYRVTPRSDNGEGKSVLFTLTYYPLLDNTTIDAQDMIYSNGAFVPEYTFQATGLPEGASIVWQWKSGDIIGSNSSGIDRIPAFTAKNITNAKVTATYEYWIEYGGCTSSTGSNPTFDIVVLPASVGDADLSVTPIESQTICYSDDFSNITLEAKHRYPSVNDLTTGTLTFEWELIDGGTNVVSSTVTKDIITPAAGSVSTTWDLSTAPASVIGEGKYRVTPIWNNNRGVATIFTLTRLPEAKVDQVNDIVLCNESLLAINFTSDNSNTVYEWKVVGGVSQLGIPAAGTASIQVAKLVNNTDLPIVETIEVTPRFPIVANAQTTPCPGTPMTFDITVLPTPTADRVNNIVVENGTVIPNEDVRLQFNGTATSFLWTSSNPAINKNGSAPSSGEVVDNGSGDFFMPGFTAQNTSQDPIMSKITVTPVYAVGNHRCTGTATEFYIVVASKPSIANIANQVACEDEITSPITPQGLPSGDGYHIRWTGGSAIGLANSNPAVRYKSIPSFTTMIGSDKNNPTEVTITVTPILTIGTEEFLGNDVQFTYSVTPKTRMVIGYEENRTENVSYCQGDVINLEIEATGYDLKYQWYKDHIAIPGATNSTYAVAASDVDIKHTGKYYAMVTGYCNSVKSMTYDVLVKVNVVSQRWNDALVLNCNPNENGGFDFISYQWYTLNGSTATRITGENRSYLYVAGGLSTTTEYFVEAITKDGFVYQSCPVIGKAEEAVKISIYPNPVKTGEPVTVEASLPDSDLNQMKIQVLSMSRVISTTKATGRTTMITMPNTAGVYVINVLIGNDSKSFKVIVK